jgi:hypothetical protein
MIPRGPIVAALIMIELAIAGEAVIALRGGQFAPPQAARLVVPTGSPTRIVEDGPHDVFDASGRPALSVDIGYADLTIITREASQIDVSVSASNAFGFFRATAPINARSDGEILHIATDGGPMWAIGDDRMVTVVVPPETRVTVVNAGDIKAIGLRAEASLKSIGHGSVTVDDYDAPTLVAASHGRISLDGVVAGRLDATSTDGRIEGSALHVRDGSVDSSGRVTLGFAAGSDTLVTAETNNGRVRLSGLATTATRVTGSGDSDDDSSAETIRLGAGDGHLTVHASDGNINLAQQG